ncbi:hypothetical protein RRG08_039764 [Elysia crispata]|uniref:Uncharacterized protein n=1 Tax=Elysia crispata TaxID=231223 RepID=A0AAE1DLV2_9GAST|nr:hypothetical protein RRG08_039764 [Elysia crispata]
MNVLIIKIAVLRRFVSTKDQIDLEDGQFGNLPRLTVRINAKPKLYVIRKVPWPEICIKAHSSAIEIESTMARDLHQSTFQRH